jgi:hypothetical protein
LKNPNVPILWVVNRHPLSDPDNGPLDATKTAKILKDIRNKINKHDHYIKTSSSQMAGTITKADNTVIQSLKTSVDATPSRVCYIDPTVPLLVAQLHSQIVTLQTVPLSAMKFDKANKHRPSFDLGME